MMRVFGVYEWVLCVCVLCVCVCVCVCVSVGGLAGVLRYILMA